LCRFLDLDIKEIRIFSRDEKKQDNNIGLYANPSKIDAIATLFQRCVDMSQTERQNFTNENDRLLATIFNKEKMIEKLLKLVTSKD